MSDAGWSVLVAFLTSVGYGVASAIVPLVNAEAYVVVSQVSAVVGASPIAVGVAIGQTIGKLPLFSGVRRGKESRFVRHRRRPHRRQAEGAFRQRFDTAMAWLLRLVGTKRWGLPIVLVAAVVGIPSAVRRRPARRCDQDEGVLVRLDGADRPGHPVRAGRRGFAAPGSLVRAAVARPSPDLVGGR